MRKTGIGRIKGVGRGQGGEGVEAKEEWILAPLGPDTVSRSWHSLMELMKCVFVAAVQPLSVFRSSDCETIQPCWEVSGLMSPHLQSARTRARERAPRKKKKHQQGRTWLDSGGKAASTLKVLKRFFPSRSSVIVNIRGWPLPMGSITVTLFLERSTRRTGGWPRPSGSGGFTLSTTLTCTAEEMQMEAGCDG